MTTRRHCLSAQELVSLERLARLRVIDNQIAVNRVWRDLIDHPWLAAYPRNERALIASCIIYAGTGIELML